VLNHVMLNTANMDYATTKYKCRSTCWKYEYNQSNNQSINQIFV